MNLKDEEFVTSVALLEDEGDEALIVTPVDVNGSGNGAGTPE